jgi:predicted YcjX-like family ATPase
MKRLKNEFNSLVNRGVDRHLRLAVTGLSRSGKTAFITAMVNQLLNLHAGAITAVERRAGRTSAGR